MEIEVIESPYLKSNMYVLSEDNHSIMIDPCENYQMKNTRIGWITYCLPMNTMTILAE